MASGPPNAPLATHYRMSLFELPIRCALAVRKEWDSVEDCLRFWVTTTNDDKAAKAALIDKMADVCFKCSAYKAGCYHNRAPVV